MIATSSIIRDTIVRRSGAFGQAGRLTIADGREPRRRCRPEQR